MKTFIPKAADIDRKWYVVDADGMVLGRLASQVANILRGKNKPIYTPNMDTGDYVIIINASKAVLTGKKLDQKVYYHHSGYAGGLKETKYRKLMAEKPEFAVRHAVIGMLPKEVPHTTFQQIQTTNWFNLPDGTWLTVEDCGELDGYCWYRKNEK